MCSPAASAGSWGYLVAKSKSVSREEAKQRRNAPLITPSDLGVDASADIAGGMNGILADVFALYLKTRNFHWHMSGPHFRDYHLLLDEHADQLYAMTDPIAERKEKRAGQRCARSGILHASSESRITTPNSSTRSTCLPSCARTIRHWRADCAKYTIWSTNTVISQRPA